MRQIFRVIVGDGTTYDCEVRRVGGLRHGAVDRWVIRSGTAEYIGPIAQPDRSPEAVADAIEWWWTIKQLLEQGASSLEPLARLLRDIEDEPPHLGV